MKGGNTKLLLAIAGAALVAGFFMPWIEIGRLGSASGWQIVKSGQVALVTRLILALCPIGGAALLAAALKNDRRAGTIALGMGLGVLGYVGYKVAQAFLAVTGIGLWIVLAAAVIALGIGLVARPTSSS
jgi:hypothetical protein